MPAIYLDYNSTTPLDPLVLEVMLPWFTERYGNAASKTHSFGWEAEAAVKIAREQVASLIGAYQEEIIFTSGSTEAINLGLKGVAERYSSRGKHIITAATEHKAVLDTCNFLESHGNEITVLDVNRDGIVNPGDLRKALRADTVLVCIMVANNETGAIQPVRELAEITHSAGSLFMTDATQAVGKIPVDVNTDGIDILCMSAHKMYGPKGTGSIFIRRKNPRVTLSPQIHGGGHESGYRSGTLNVPGIVGFGKACEIARTNLAEFAKRMSAMRDRLEKELIRDCGAIVNGGNAIRLPNTSNIRFAGIEADSLIMKVRGIAVSTGSACTSAVMQPSHVLRSMGLSDAEAYSSVRFSLGRTTTDEEITGTLRQLMAQMTNQ